MNTFHKNLEYYSATINFPRIKTKKLNQFLLKSVSRGEKRCRASSRTEAAPKELLFKSAKRIDFFSTPPKLEVLEKISWEAGGRAGKVCDALRGRNEAAVCRPRARLPARLSATRLSPASPPKVIPRWACADPISTPLKCHLPIAATTMEMAFGRRDNESKPNRTILESENFLPRVPPKSARASRPRHNAT